MVMTVKLLTICSIAYHNVQHYSFPKSSFFPFSSFSFVHVLGHVHVLVHACASSTYAYKKEMFFDLKKANFCHKLLSQFEYKSTNVLIIFQEGFTKRTN